MFLVFYVLLLLYIFVLLFLLFCNLTESQNDLTQQVWQLLKYAESKLVRSVLYFFV